ncbi:ty3-gypsy retrotransposon protein [Tanacetum coccineum]
MTLYLYGRLPPVVIPYSPRSSEVVVIDELLVERDGLLRQLRHNLLAAKNRMEMKANRKRRDVEFDPANRYYGPFEVLERIGKVAYRLALPLTSKIHLVFHVSLLKLFSRTSQEIVAGLPEEKHEGHPLEQPLAICDTRLILRNGLTTRQVFVQWTGSSPEEATWEWLSEFQATYPSYHLEDKVIVKGNGNVTPTSVEEEGLTPGVEEEEGRPKRVTSVPLWHKDYIIGFWSPHTLEVCKTIDTKRIRDTKADIAPIYDTDAIAEVPYHTKYSDHDMINMFPHEEYHSELPESSQSTYVEQQYDSKFVTATLEINFVGGDVEQHVINNKETNAYFESLLNNFQVELYRCVTVNRDAKAKNERLTVELVQYKGQQTFFEYKHQKYDELEIGYRNYV